jgi:hypothetical protein
MSQGSTTSKQPLIRYVNRKQMSWRAVDVEHLIGEDHPARAIWALVGRLDLRAFYGAIESSVEEGGRPAFDPQLLISLWIYAYSRGIGSAREVARRCEYDPAFQWLTVLAEVFRELRGTSPNVSVPKMISLLRQRAKGRIGFKELGQGFKLVESDDLKILYMGYAVKPLR